MRPPSAADWVIMASSKKRQQQREEGAFCYGFIIGCAWSIALYVGLHEMGLL